MRLRFLTNLCFFIILTIFHIPMSGLGVMIWFVFAQIQVPWRIHGTGALGPYMSGCFFNGKLVGKYTSPMDPIREKNKYFSHTSPSDDDQYQWKDGQNKEYWT